MYTPWGCVETFVTEVDPTFRELKDDNKEVGLIIDFSVTEVDPTFRELKGLTQTEVCPSLRPAVTEVDPTFRELKGTSSGSSSAINPIRHRSRSHISGIESHLNLFPPFYRQYDVTEVDPTFRELKVP